VTDVRNRWHHPAVGWKENTCIYMHLIIHTDFRNGIASIDKLEIPTGLCILKLLARLQED